MATIYIDPSYFATGTGTIADPFKSWASVTWTAGNSFLQKCGTTFVGGVDTGALGAASLGAESIIGSYGTGAKPIIDARTVTRGLTIRGAASYVIVQDLEIIGGATGASTRGISSGFSDDGATDNLTIRRCVVHDVVWDGVAGNFPIGIQLTGINNTITDNTIYNIGTDGLFITSNSGNQILRNTIYNVGYDRRGGLADCIQTTGDMSNSLVADNVCTNTLVDDKHGIIVAQASAGTGLVIERNTVTRNLTSTVSSAGSASIAVCIYTDQPGAVVRNNTTIGGKFGINLSGTGINCYGNEISFAEQGIYQFGAGVMQIFGNVIRDGGIGVISDFTGANIFRNTFLRLTDWAGFQDSGGASTFFQYNIVSNCTSGIRGAAAVTSSFNNFYQVTTQDGGSITSTSSLTSNPQLNGQFMPLATAVRSNAPATGRADFYGKECRGTSGAVQYQPVRSVASSRTNTTRRVVVAA
jgi:parallel beta-helix repeat protein